MATRRQKDLVCIDDHHDDLNDQVDGLDDDGDDMVNNDQDGDLLLERALQVVEDPLAVVEGELLVPGEDLDRRQHPVDRVEVLETHPEKRGRR